MSTEQKQLLYEIAKWRNKDFYNQMADHWDAENYTINNECIETIDKLENEYKEKYGSLPEWKYIDDVRAAIKTLERELNI